MENVGGVRKMNCKKCGHRIGTNINDNVKGDWEEIYCAECNTRCRMWGG